MKLILFVFIGFAINTSAQITSEQTMGIIVLTNTEVLSITNPKKGNLVYNSTNNSLCKYTGDRWVSVGINIGDIKHGFQETDHGGWIKLDGRSVSSLTPSQQTIIKSFGFTNNLPNATNAYLVQNEATPIGSVTGENTRLINQNQLPDATLSGTTDESGEHIHRYLDKAGDTSIAIKNGDRHNSHAQRNGQDTRDSRPAGEHKHNITTSSINGGVTQQALDITPKSMRVNTFIYIGL